MAQTFQDFGLSERAMELCTWIYALTEFFPKDEMFGLTSRLRCAVDSAEHNIAEGIEFRGRMTDGKLKKLLGLAHDSMQEVQAQLLVARQMKMGDQEMLQKAEALCVEISNRLGEMIQS